MLTREELNALLSRVLEGRDGWTGDEVEDVFAQAALAAELAADAWSAEQRAQETALRAQGQLKTLQAERDALAAENAALRDALDDLSQAVLGAQRDTCGPDCRSAALKALPMLASPSPSPLALAYAAAMVWALWHITSPLGTKGWAAVDERLSDAFRAAQAACGKGAQ